MTTYILPQTNTVSGAFQVFVTSDLSGLTVPTIDTILNIGPLERVLNEEIGTTEVPTLEMEVRDDYSTHTAGFWYTLLKNSADIRLRVLHVGDIDAGGTQREFFVGSPSMEEALWTERYIGSSRIRTCRFTAINIIQKLFNINMGEFQDECRDHAEIYWTRYTGQTEQFYYVLPVGTIMGIALKVAGLNPWVESTTFVYDSANPDIKYIDASNNEYAIDEGVWIPVKWRLNGNIETSPYFSDGHGSSLEKLYSGDFKTFLGDFLFNFGCYLKIEFDGLHYRPKMIQRGGRAYDTLITPGTLLSSDITHAIALKSEAVRVTDTYNRDAYTWISTGPEWPDGKSGEEPPSNMEIKVDRQILWADPDLTIIPFVFADALGVGSAVTSVVQATKFKYYNYAEGGLELSAQSAPYAMTDALARYYYKILSTQRLVLNRKYSTIQALSPEPGGDDTSPAYLDVLRRIQIDDGLGPETYYANKIRLDPASYTSEVEWVFEPSGEE